MTQTKRSLVALLAVVAILLIGGTVAWFTFNATEDVQVQTARIDFTVINGTVTANNLLPGEAVPGASVSITNSSTRAAFLRVKLDQLPTGFYHGTDTPNDIFNLTGDIMDPTRWTYINGWFYHIGPIATTTTNIPLINGVTIATTVGNEYQERTTGFRVTVDAIQGTQAAAESLWIGTGDGRITNTDATNVLNLF